MCDFCCSGLSSSLPRRVFWVRIFLLVAAVVALDGSFSPKESLQDKDGCWIVDVATAAACAAAAAATIAGCCVWLLFIAQEATMDGVVTL